MKKKEIEELFLWQGIQTISLTKNLYLKMFAKADFTWDCGGKTLYQGGTKFFQQTSL